MKEDSIDKQSVKEDALKGLTTKQMQKLLRLLKDYDDTEYNINHMQKHTNIIDKNPPGNNL